MVEIFIDEAGKFTAGDGWSVVSALVLPHSEVGRLRRKIAFVSKEWPKAPSGELKGGSLSETHLSALVDQLYPREALLFSAAIDMSRQDPAQLDYHKMMQSEGITKYLTPEHHPTLASQLRALRATLDRMPMQLYVQSLLMNVLTAVALEHATLYFAQRRPRELEKFNWTVDAKDPRKITIQEQWWRDTLAPLQESRSREHPLSRVRGKDFDYRYLDKAFEFGKEMWHPNEPSELVVGLDIKKVMSDHIEFKDSRDDIMLQAVDILTNFMRRILTGQINDISVAATIGRLQICRCRESVLQSIELLSLTENEGHNTSKLSGMVKAMSIAGRPMLRKK